MRCHNDCMIECIKRVNVGAPDPELKNSLIFDRENEKCELLDLELESGAIQVGDRVEIADKYVCELLHCERGVWIRKGSCYPG
jgi:hypothetical protein